MVGRMMNPPPPNAYSLIPKTCDYITLRDKRSFAGMIEV